MARPGGELMVRALEDEGVRLTFGIPGTHNIELYDALADSDSVRTVLVTDEQSASFMADGVWRASGELGCVNLVPGAGLTHAMSGIAEAWLDCIPMLVLSCGIRTDMEQGFQLHDVDQAAMVEPITKAQFRVATGEELYPTVRKACRLAQHGVPGPVFVEVPSNLYIFAHDVDVERQSAEFRTDRGAREPEPEALERALGLLEAAERPLLYLGLGALPARRDLVALAERLEAPVATTFQGKGVFPETHPLWLWPGFGDAAPSFVREVASESDVVLAIGCRFSEVGTGSYGMTMPAPLIHVDIDPAALGRNYRAEVPCHADSAATVAALLERLTPHAMDRKLRARIRAGHQEVEAEWEADTSSEGVTPFVLLRALQRVYGPDAVYTTDSGNGTFLGMEILRLQRPRRFLAPVDYSCMGYAVPAAIGAKLADPSSPVLALAGDGAFLMTGLELLTAANYDVPVVVFVLRDRELAQISQIQDTVFNRRTASRVHDFDLRGLATGLGVDLLELETDDAIPEVLERAAEIAGGGRPVLVDVAIDYSRKTYFTKGIVKTYVKRLPWKDRLRFVGRIVGRKIFGP